MKPEVKSFAFKLDGPPDDEGRFTGYAAVFGNVDKGNDLIEPGAFTKTLQENPEVPILWAHNPDEPIGVSASMSEDGKGLKVEGQLAMEVQRAREVHALMRLGAIKGLSIGYQTVKRNFKGAVRHLQELKLGEFSPVVFPMNELAQVSGVKDLYGYATTEGVGALLTAISCLSDFLVEEVQEGDTDDAARAQAILNSLAKLLQSEIGELASEAAEDADAEPVDATELMREPIELAVKELQALLEREPVAATHNSTEPPAEDAEPALATLRALTSAISR